MSDNPPKPDVGADILDGPLCANNGRASGRTSRVNRAACELLRYVFGCFLTRRDFVGDEKVFLGTIRNETYLFVHDLPRISGGLDVNDDAELHVDEVIVGVSEECRTLVSSGPLSCRIGWRHELRDDIACVAPGCVVECRQILLHRAT